jgi:hypothetical protein
VEIPLLLFLIRVSAQAAATPPLRIAEPDIRCPRIELRAAGALTFILRVVTKFQIGRFVLRCSVWQVGHGRHPAATNRVARHSMSEDRAPSRGVRFASETNTQMSSGSGLKRLYYKAFAEAKPPALISTFLEELCRQNLPQ